MDNHIALFVTMHPASLPKQSTLLNNLQRGAREYYRLPSSRCIAWSYLTPRATGSSENNDLIIAGLEIYTNKIALQEQLNDKTFFQPFERLVVDEQLYAKEGTMLAWYLAAGFVTRIHERVNGGGGSGIVVRVHQMTCAGSGEQKAVVKGLGEFANWSRESDSGILTFAIFTRKKSAREVLIYMRYRDEVAMQRIEERPEYQKIW